jgi:hypothetical protein
MGMGKAIFYRTRGGAMVHVEGCPMLRRAKKAWRWDWAEREGIVSKEQMLMYLAGRPVDGIRTCKVCLKWVNWWPEAMAALEEVRP